MALTTNIKHARVDVMTGETDHEYYTEAEWAAVLADLAASALPMAQSAKSAALSAQAQAEVNAVIQPPALTQGMARMNELLMVRIINGAWTADESTEVAAMQATLNETRAVRAREAAALAAVAAAATITEVEDVVL